MRIVGLTDIHGNLNGIERMKTVLAAADIVFLVGDITNFGYAPDVSRVIDRVRDHAGRILAVSGNCDYPEVDRFLDGEEINLHARGETIDGIGFVGVGGSLITPFNTPNEYSEAELTGFLERGKSQLPPETPSVLISHQPPLNTGCDRIDAGIHVGSLAIREFIESHQPLVCFTGHIHESVGIDRIGKTWIVNPGQLARGKYAFAEIIGNEAIVEIREG